MNISAGEILEKGRKLSELDPREFFKKLKELNFVGFIRLTIKGKFGFEEATLVLDKGSLVACDYEYFYFNKMFVGEQALNRCLNAFISNFGTLDSFTLTSYQLQLILTLNGECVLKKPLKCDELSFPQSFNYSYEEELLPKEEEDKEKLQLLKKFGLTSLKI
ncbi:MAG: DUF2226 domain-containing protein [archaeon]